MPRNVRSNSYVIDVGADMGIGVRTNDETICWSGPQERGDLAQNFLKQVFTTSTWQVYTQDDDACNPYGDPMGPGAFEGRGPCPPRVHDHRWATHVGDDVACCVDGVSST